MWISEISEVSALVTYESDYILMSKPGPKHVYYKHVYQLPLLAKIKKHLQYPMRSKVSHPSMTQPLATPMRKQKQTYTWRPPLQWTTLSSSSSSPQGYKTDPAARLPSWRRPPELSRCSQLLIGGDSNSRSVTSVKEVLIWQVLLLPTLNTSWSQK